MDERENVQRRRGKNGEIVWFCSTFHPSTTVCILAERCNVMHWKSVAGSSENVLGTSVACRIAVLILFANNMSTNANINECVQCVTG